MDQPDAEEIGTCPEVDPAILIPYSGLRVSDYGLSLRGDAIKMGRQALSVEGPTPLAPNITVVVPAYLTAQAIGAVLRAFPPQVTWIVVVDDASPDDVAGAVEAVGDPRIVLIRHAVNSGVGAAMKTGLAKAVELGADIVVKLDSDGQMDPALLPALIEPLRSQEADMVKGNRFTELEYTRQMPLVRRLGNLALSFAVKMASGYWGVFDPCNGYLAFSGKLARALQPARLADRYFFEISLLCEAYLHRAAVRDVAMPTVYGDEVSSLRPVSILFDFLPRLLTRTLRRIGVSYFLRDFNVVSVFLAAGIPSTLFGALWSLYHWYRSTSTGVVTTTGTVMIGMLPIILGFQLLLQALVLDVQAEPGRSGR